MVNPHTSKYALSEAEKRETMRIGEERAVAWIRERIQNGGRKILLGEGREQVVVDYDYALKLKIVHDFQDQAIREAEKRLHDAVSCATAKSADILNMAREIAAAEPKSGKAVRLGVMSQPRRQG